MTVATARYRLDKLLDPVAYDLIEDITPARAAELYAIMVASGCSVDYHRNALSEAQRFGRRLVELGAVRRDPFVGVAPVGQRKAGKPQLRVDEARKLVDACLGERTEESLAVLLALMLGPRAAEVANLQLRDVDDGGRLLWIDISGTKTRSARRFLEVPELVRPMLLEHASSRLPSAPRVERREPDGVRLFPGRTRYWVYWHCRRLCRVAGVVEVSAQALRGSHATFATAAGATGELVQAALGHTSVAVGDRHYTDPSVKASTRATRASLRVISGGKQ